MVTSNVPAEYVREAKRLFAAAPDRLDKVRTNPVTGYRWLNGADPIGEQIRAAARALMARDQFADMAPANAPPLPLSYAERERLKVGGVSHLVAWFARSLEGHAYDLGVHPPFEPYARGVLASPYTPYFITNDQALQQSFSPRALKGLGPGLYWDPTLADIRSAPRWQQRFFLDSSPPPLSSGSHTVVERQDANVPPCYAPTSDAFLQLDDDFVAHATKLAPFKRLPSGWGVHKPAEVFTRRAGGYQLWLANSDYGWLIERKELFGAEEVLASIFMGFPVLCDTHVMAARLAEAAHQGLRPEYQLTWISTV
jgi:hypothetical protein